MNFNRRQFGAIAAGSAAFFTAPHSFAQLQNLVRFFVGFPPGTTPDVLARKVGDKLSRGYARSAVVETRTGAGGQLAVTALKTAPTDGLNVLLTPMSILGVFLHTYKKLPYDPVADLTPVSMGVLFDYGIGVGPAVPQSVKTIADLAAWYKAHPDRANMGSSSTGSTQHFIALMLGRAAGVDLTHVGYRGSNAAVQDMLGGNLPALCAPLGTYLNQPKLRVLATSGAKRSRFTPAIPTLTEQGFKDLVFDEWYGFYLPAKAAPEVVRGLNAALQEALLAQDTVETLNSFGMEAAPSSPERLAQALDQDIKRWGAIVKDIGFSVES